MDWEWGLEGLSFECDENGLKLIGVIFSQLCGCTKKQKNKKHKHIALYILNGRILWNVNYISKLCQIKNTLMTMFNLLPKMAS